MIRVPFADMTKLLRVFLAVAMLLSSTGVIIATMTCTKKGAGKTAMCEMCRKAALKGTAKKSCCVFTTKYLVLKTNFSKPSLETPSLNPIAVLIPANLTVISVDRIPSATLNGDSHFALSSRDNCALLSTYRI